MNTGPLNIGPLPHCDVTTVEYWTSRVAEYSAIGDYESMLWHDFRRVYLWRFVREVLPQYKSFAVLDVACGHGQFCDLFEPDKYTGIDFCPAMIELAQKRHPDYFFLPANVRHCKPHSGGGFSFDGLFDYVFEVNSLRAMGMKWCEEFRDLCLPWAKFGVMCFEFGSVGPELKAWSK